MSHGRVTIFGALTGSQPARIQHRIHASIGKFHACSHACMTGCLAGWLQKLFQWPCDMMRRAAGYARPPDAEARERAPEPGKGQAQLPRAARRSESTSETRSGMRALEWLQKWLNALHLRYPDLYSRTSLYRGRILKYYRTFGFDCIIQIRRCSFSKITFVSLICA